MVVSTDTARPLSHAPALGRGVDQAQLKGVFLLGARPYSARYQGLLGRAEEERRGCCGFPVGVRVGFGYDALLMAEGGLEASPASSSHQDMKWHPGFSLPLFIMGGRGGHGQA